MRNLPRAHDRAGLAPRTSILCVSSGGAWGPTCGALLPWTMQPELRSAVLSAPWPPRGPTCNFWSTSLYLLAVCVPLKRVKTGTSQTRRSSSHRELRKVLGITSNQGQATPEQYSPHAHWDSPECRQDVSNRSSHRSRRVWKGAACWKNSWHVSPNAKHMHSRDPAIPSWVCA